MELFVAVLGASNLTYAEALESQKIPMWLAANSRALEYFKGVPELVVPDQLRSAVSGPDRYEPTIQRSFEEWAEHYGTTILPARPGKPRDKAKVEGAVLIAQRWILARLRHQQFFSLAELNERIAELLQDMNSRTMRRYGKSRRELFEEIEAPALRALPQTRYEYAEWSRAKINIDYHLQVADGFYSAPYQRVGEVLDVRITTTTVELYTRTRGERLYSHKRAARRGSYVTEPAHMPSSHRKHLDWSPSRLLAWAKKDAGPETAALVEAMLATRNHPEQAYRSCLGLMRLAKRYGVERIENASARALVARAYSYKHVESILKHGLDRLAKEPEPAPKPQPSHINVRGSDYYC